MNNDRVNYVLNIDSIYRSVGQTRDHILGFFEDTKDSYKKNSIQGSGNDPNLDDNPSEVDYPTQKKRGRKPSKKT